jgi:Holliday junction DNA helicase RuvB
LGKTTLAGVLANEMGTELHTVSAPSITRADDLRRTLVRVQYGDVYFLDEIHALARDVEETLYPVAEDFRLEVVSPLGEAQRLRLPEFTLIGATTRRGQVSAPMRDRFQLIEALTYYAPVELAEIASRTATRLGVTLAWEAAKLLGERSRGTPRITNRLAARVVEWAHAEGLSSMTAAQADDALNDWGIDDRGLDPLDRAVLYALEHTFDGGPVGVQSLALAIGEDDATIADAVEPYLTRLGLMARTARGRVITDRGRAHLSDPMGDEFNDPEVAADEARAMGEYEDGLAEGALWAEQAYEQREAGR